MITTGAKDWRASRLQPTHRGLYHGLNGEPVPVESWRGVQLRVFAQATITNTGATIVDGRSGLTPGHSVTGFPPGTVTGTME